MIIQSLFFLSALQFVLSLLPYCDSYQFIASQFQIYLPVSALQ